MARMHQAATLQFERTVHEFVRWRAVPEKTRSPAPAWWWGPAFAVIDVQQPMPEAWCIGLELPAGAGYSEGAQVLLTSLSGQTTLPWPDGFPDHAGHLVSA